MGPPHARASRPPYLFLLSFLQFFFSLSPSFSFSVSWNILCPFILTLDKNAVVFPRRALTLVGSSRARVFARDRRDFAAFCSRRDRSADVNGIARRRSRVFTDDCRYRIIAIGRSARLSIGDRPPPFLGITVITYPSDLITG